MAKTRRIVRRPVTPPALPTETKSCECGALTLIFEADDRVIIRTTTKLGAGWMKLHQFIVCSHCNTEIRYSPMPCWEGKESGGLWSTKDYMGAGVDGEKRSVPPRSER